MSVIATVEGDYNYFTNEFGRTVSTTNVATGKTYIDLGCRGVPIMRFMITGFFGGFSCICSLFDNNPDFGASSRSIGLFSTTLVLCGLNMIVSLIFCKNMYDKERAALLANQKGSSESLSSYKCLEGCGLLAYAFAAAGVTYLFVSTLTKK